MTRKFDIIVFGASGFTGELVVEELARNIFQENLRWAVAGRNHEKLQKVLRKVQQRLKTDCNVGNIKIFEAKVDDRESLEPMCENTKLLINCVGPYAKYGEPVLQACLKFKTHVIDITVEISYINDIMLKYHEEAESLGVYILNSCGIGYTFFEMAVQVLQQQYAGSIDKIDLFIKPEVKLGSVNFATWDSIVNVSSGSESLLAGRQKVLSQIMNKTKSKFSILELSWPVKPSKEARGLGFILPPIYHTLHLGLEMKELLFEEKPVKVNYYWTLYSPATFIIFAVIGFFLIFLLPFRAGRWLLTKYARFFSCGLVRKSTLAEETKDTSTLNFTAVTKVSRQTRRQNWNICGDPSRTAVLYGSSPSAYKTTAICVVQVALTVLQETDCLPNRGGVYTPLAAFAKTSLPSKLQKNGIAYKEKQKSSCELSPMNNV